MPVQISLPFSFSSSGGVNVSNQETKIWSDRVISVLFTKLKERVMFLEYGSNIASLTFETETVATEIIKKEVPSLFSRWLPDLTFVTVSTKSENAQLGDNTLSISVEYLLPNKQKNITTANVKLGSFTQTGVLIEEL